MLTKEEIEERKQLLISTVSANEVLSQYGVSTRHNRCRGWCHGGKDFNMKVFRTGCHCFVCGRSFDIFDITMHFNNCDFWTAFEILGGTERISFSTSRKAKTAVRQRDSAITKVRAEKAELKRINAYITAYRELIKISEPFSDLWCHCQNQLMLELYHLECMMLQTEKR